MEAIKTYSLTKRYKDTVAVDGLSITVCKGELFALLGVNGAGKTTAIKLLSCLSQCDVGDAFIMGKSIVSEPLEVKKLIAVSPQETAVAGNLTVKENLELICGVYKIAKSQWDDKISTLCSTLELSSVLYKKASKLSGGWMRRLSIAMALISDPEVLFLDEPTLGLDVIARRELWEIIRALKGKTTIVLTTHYMEEAEALSDKIGIMKSGKMLICDTVENIKKFANTESFENAFIRIVRGEEY